MSQFLHRTLVICGLGIPICVGLLSGSVPADCVAANSQLPNFEITDPRGNSITQDAVKDASLVVVAFLGTECPLAKLYASTLSELQQQYQAQGVKLIAVMSNRQDSLEEIAAFTRRTKLSFPIGKDLGNRFADAVTAERTPEVFLYDAQRTLRYRGRIDDQYGIGTILEQPRRSDLRIAIDEVLAGEPVTTAVTEAVGCIIGRRKTQHDDQVTYHQHVAPILQRHCVECHREGEIGPFALDEYDEVAGWADMIVETTHNGRMPPWHAGEKSTVSFRNERHMSEQELNLLARWADSGTAEGEQETSGVLQGAAVLHPVNEVRDAKGRLWDLPRKPDHVFTISESPVSIPATGEVKYQYFRVDPGFQRDVWVSAMQLRPGNRRVVHHILALVRDPKSRERLHAERGFLDGYVPGYRVESFAPGYAKKIPAGSELIFQMHYTPTGAPETDLSEFAIIEADESEITHEIRTDSVLQTKLKIPPGDAEHRVTAHGPPFPENASLLAMMPHMHVRGKSFRFVMQSSPSWWSKKRESTILLDVPDYDFNWQTSYVLEKPLPLPAGGRFTAHAVYDNSEQNLSNPDPTATVRWGDQTWEEMMIGYYHYAVPR